MSEEQFGFFIGFTIVFLSAMVIWLFHILAERTDKKHPGRKQPAERLPSKATAAIKAKRGNAKKPCNKDSGGASGSQIDDNVFEKHKAPNGLITSGAPSTDESGE